MPGDELLPTPDRLSTRAVTIDAPPEAIWPWLVQWCTGQAGPGARVEVYDRPRILTMRSADRRSVWILGLYPMFVSTRLVSRRRVVAAGRSRQGRIARRLARERGVLIPERRTMLDIKRRAEEATVTAGPAWA